MNRAGSTTLTALITLALAVLAFDALIRWLTPLLDRIGAAWLATVGHRVLFAIPVLLALGILGQALQEAFEGWRDPSAPSGALLFASLPTALLGLVAGIPAIHLGLEGYYRVLWAALGSVVLLGTFLRIARSRRKPAPPPPALDLQPTLRGELVELRPLRPDDFDALYAVASDPLIWEQHPVPTRHERPVFQYFFREALESGGALAVVDRSTGEQIGSSRYHGYDPGAGEVEIGWTFLARSHWGGAYNGEMKRLMIDHALARVERVVFVVGFDNLRSQRALEKIGAVRVGTRPDARGKQSALYEVRRRSTPATPAGEAEVAAAGFGIFRSLGSRRP